MRDLLQQERSFNIKPVGIKYICEHCNEGEMKSVPPSPYEQDSCIEMKLYPHQCTKCNLRMQLPKIYPMIEWIPEEDDTSLI